MAKHFSALRSSDMYRALGHRCCAVLNSRGRLVDDSGRFPLLSSFYPLDRDQQLPKRWLIWLISILENLRSDDDLDQKHILEMIIRFRCGALALTISSAALAAQPSAVPPVSAPLRELPWGQLNFLHTTDTHGWHAGHLQEWASTFLLQHLKLPLIWKQAIVQRRLG